MLACPVPTPNGLSTAILHDSRTLSKPKKTILTIGYPNYPGAASGSRPTTCLLTESSRSSKRSDKTTASVTDANYRDSLRRARNTISRQRTSPEMDGATIAELNKKRREIQDKGEDEFIRQVAGSVVPGLNTLPNPKLTRSSNQLWFNSVASACSRNPFDAAPSAEAQARSSIWKLSGCFQQEPACGY